VEGQNVAIVRRRPEPGRAEQVPALAMDVVASKPDVILAANPHSIEAMIKATRTIPIVGIDLESDPVARGWVASLGRPGGNFTGFFLDAPEISGKHLRFLREAKPDVTRVAVLGDPRVNDRLFRATETIARSAGLALHTFPITILDDIPGVIAEAARQRAGALLALTSPLINAGTQRITEEAVRHRLPTICGFAPTFAEQGGLLSYGPEFPDLFRRAAGYGARILKGSKVGDLPVQRPEKFVLAINLKTARALKLTLPQSLLGRADRVIE
jgi:putative ABC transport system substrate-binding protein